MLGPVRKGCLQVVVFLEVARAMDGEVSVIMSAKGNDMSVCMVVATNEDHGSYDAMQQQGALSRTDNKAKQKNNNSTCCVSNLNFR